MDDPMMTIVKEYSQLGFSYVVAFWLLFKTDKVLQEILRTLLALKTLLEQILAKLIELLLGGKKNGP